MEEKINLSYFLGEEKRPAALGILGILKNSFKVTIKNRRNLIFVAAFMLAYYSLSELADQFILSPVSRDFTSKPSNVRLSELDPSSREEILRDVRIILAYKLIAWTLSSLILASTLVAVTHSTHEAYSAKVIISFREMLLSIRRSWKRPLMTTLCMALVCWASITVFLIAFVIISVMMNDSISIFMAIGVIFLGFISYVYLYSIWNLSLVVSVLEENSSGMKAIERARELMKGKRAQGCVLMSIYLLASFEIYGTFSLLETESKKSSGWISLAVIVASDFWTVCVKKLFLFVVFTVLYHECRRRGSSRSDHFPVEGKTSVVVYAPIAAN